MFRLFFIFQTVFRLFFIFSERHNLEAEWQFLSKLMTPDQKNTLNAFILA